jgi:hypothetical protein
LGRGQVVETTHESRDAEAHDSLRFAKKRGSTVRGHHKSKSLLAGARVATLVTVSALITWQNSPAQASIAQAGNAMSPKPNPIVQKEMEIGQQGNASAASIGTATALRLAKLRKSYKGPLETSEYQQLLGVLLTATTKAKSADLDDFSIDFFRAFRPKDLGKLIGELVDESGDFRPPSEKRSKAKQLLEHLEYLFGVALHKETSTGRRPEWASYIKQLDPSCLNGLLQGEHKADAKISSASLAFLAGLALPNPHAMYGFAPVRFDGQPTRSLRLTVLDLLSNDQDSGGRALKLYLAPKDRSDPSMLVASEKLLALLTPARLHDGPFRPGSSEAEDLAAAKLVERYFLRAFDGGLETEADLAGEVLELAIANTAQLKDTPAAMIRALATGFAGAMIDPAVGSDLLRAAANGSGDERGRADLLHLPTQGFDPNDLDLSDFIVRMLSDRQATGQIVAALGPMVAAQGKLSNSLPANSNLMDGVGFLMGPALKKFGQSSDYRRVIHDAVGVGLTVAFTPIEGASMPASGVAAGARGPGVLQSISTMTKTESKTSLKDHKRSAVHYLQLVYVSASFRWLEPTVKEQILQQLKRSNSQGTAPKAQITVAENGDLRIANIAVLTEDRLRDLADALVTGATKPQDNATEGQLSIDRFAAEATKGRE